MMAKGLALLLGMAVGFLPATSAMASAKIAVKIAVFSLDGLENEPLEVSPETDPPAAEEELEEGLPEENLPEENLPEENLPEEVRLYDPLRSPTTCPLDIETLTALLIRDIPTYTNRVLQRTVAVLPDNRPDSSDDVDSPEDGAISNRRFVRSRREAYRPSTVLIAGRSELEPLDLKEYTFTTDPAAGEPLTQLFFTTLSRQYSGLQFHEVQEYHWLFLVQSTDGWWPAFIFSAVDDPNTARAPLPPRENSRGSVGQAVQLWLRDCRAGAIDQL